MVPVEYVWIGTVLIFMFIGMVRGFLKELGVTTVMVVLLFGLSRLEGQLEQVGTMVATRLPAGDTTEGLVLLILYTVIIILVAFISYQGETLAFEGSAGGVRGFFFGALTGAINGYLIAGTVWHYASQYSAVLQKMGLIQGELSGFAGQLLNFMPPKLLGPFLPFLVVFMILLRVIR